MTHKLGDDKLSCDCSTSCSSKVQNTQGFVSHLDHLSVTQVTQQSTARSITPSQTVLDVSHIDVPEFTDLSTTHQTPLSFSSLSCTPLISLDSKFGVKSISSSGNHTLLLTYSGEVYGWGDNDHGKVLYNGPSRIKSPIKLPLTNIVTISACCDHSLAISSEGKLYGWGWNDDNRISTSEGQSLPITLINIPYNINEVYGGDGYSFALTQEGKVVKWGDCESFKLLEELNSIVLISVYGDSFVALNGNGEFFYFDSECDCCRKVPLTNCFSPIEPFRGCLLFNGDFLFVIDFNGDVWRFDKGDDVPFNHKPTKVLGLNNIVSISGYFCQYLDRVYSAIDNNGKVFVWGQLSAISELYEDRDEPIGIEALTNIEGISLGEDFLFAFNKNTVWAWGRNDIGQLGTGDLIDRPQPVKIFGSEILGSFQYPKQPLDSMFSGLIKLVYWEYLQYLQELFGNHPYVKARFYTKCGISKRVAQFAKEVFNDHQLQNKIFLEDPEDLTLNENICDLQLRLSADYGGPSVINTRIKTLDLYYDWVDYDPEILSSFPNVEVVRLGGRWIFDEEPQNLTHLSNLKCLDLAFDFEVEQLPSSLVKLVLKNDHINFADLSYLSSLKELVVLFGNSYSIMKGKIPLPHSIVRLDIWMEKPVKIQIQIPNLKELIIHDIVPTNITEQNFPSLKFVQFIGPDKDSLSNSPLSPTKLINQGLIKSVKLTMNEYLVELSGFLWWIQYPAERFLIDVFRDKQDKIYKT
ncbi:hypothetical protein P9112_010646 [Eukaryota sp. TZLM1-RC]